MSRMNVIAVLVIALVLAGAAALYRLDNSDGGRTSRADSARIASD
ncbi:hypothetical protein [Bradyrhizobium sp. CCGE-LA001]|nr:hypothetical protein [Bradyrhizobium sp. CCGE-LA001]